uniref:Uncharacterized protein n=1 Tax=Ascaris lumbricoides TaxID=6252 RepID=A0A0M3HZJ9_ASCLU
MILETPCRAIDTPDPTVMTWEKRLFSSDSTRHNCLVEWQQNSMDESCQ